MLTLRKFYFYAIFKLIQKLFGINWANNKKNVAISVTNGFIILHLLFLILIMRKFIPQFNPFEIAFWLLIIAYDIYLNIRYFNGEKYILVIDELNNLRKEKTWVFSIIYLILPALVLLYLSLPNRIVI